MLFEGEKFHGGGRVWYFNVIWLKSIHTFTFIVTVFTASASIRVSARNASLYIAVMIFCAQPYLKPCFMCPFYILSTCPSKGLCTALPSTKRESQRGSLLKGVAVQGVLYQSILNAKLTGRKKLGRKRSTSNRDDRKLENTFKQRRFKHLGELHKEWTEAGVSASRVTTLRHLQEKVYQATSERERSSETSYLG